MNKRVWKNLAKKLEEKPTDEFERTLINRAEAEGGAYMMRIWDEP